MRFFLALAVLLLVLPGCRNLPTIEKGMCGNGVIEPSAGEDCDRFAPPGSACRQPGQSLACRFDCSLAPDGTRPNCPSGMGCAADGICRWASGGFERTPVSVRAAPYELSTADLDGDRRQDLVVTERNRAVVHYFGESASPDQELDIPMGLGPSPAVGELSGDALPDLVIPSGSGILAELSTADRSLVTTAYPSISAPPDTEQLYLIGAEVLPSSPGDETVLFARSNGVLVPGLVYVGPDGVVGLTVLVYEPDQLAGEVGVGNLDEDPVASPCDELVMPFQGADRIFLFSPCRLDSTGTVVPNAAGSTTVVYLPSGDKVLGPLALSDLDHDGHLDFAVAVSTNGAHYIDVAYGVGDGTFNSTSPVPSSTGDGKASHAVGIKQATPLAIGDLDRDGMPDYVDAEGAYVNRSTGFETVATSEPETWGEAVIDDLNDNGLPDVVAANAKQPGAVFLDGAGGGLVSRFDVPTEGPLTHLCVGDYDGDLLKDVGAAEDVGFNDSELVTVMFGRSHGAPEPPISAGLLDHVLQTVHSRSSWDIYAVDALSAVVRARDGSFAFAGFSGSGDRQLRSPFSLVQTEGTSVDVTGVAFKPVRLAAGHFDQSKHGGLAELGQKYTTKLGDEYRLWLCPMTGLAAIQLKDPRSSDPLPSDVEWDKSEMSSGDLDGDGLDELVLLAPTTDGSGSHAYVARSADTGDGHYAWKLSSATTLQWRFEHTEGQEGAPGDAGGGRVLVKDLDADKNHHPDVLALAPATKKSKGALVLFRGGGAAALKTPEVLPETPDGPATAFAPIQTDRDPAFELALLAGTRVYIADLGSDGRYRVAPDSVAELSDAALITSGDFDNDGVDDLALANASSVAVFRGVPGIR